MPVRRHAILYDIERWRRMRLPLLVLATACLAATVVEPMFQHGKSSQSTTLISFAGAALYGLAFNFWLRQRFSSLAVEGEHLVVRRTGSTMRIALHEVKRAKVARISATANKPERRKVLPRPAERWLEEEAVTVRLETAADQLIKLRRLLGRQYLFENDLVVPVIDPHGLLAEIQDAMPRPEQAPGTPRRRRRR